MTASEKAEQERDAIKLDSTKFSLFQKELHRRNETIIDGKKSGDSEGLTTIFQHKFKKLSWYTPSKVKLAASLNVDGVTYTADNTYDHLFKTFLRFSIPPIRVKPDKVNEYRIAWTHNIGINIVESATLTINEVKSNYFDGTSHDILSQYGYLVKPGFKKHHLTSIGAIPRLTRWSSTLPAHQCNVLQPFYYAKANHLAFPLLGSSLTQLKHVYKLRLGVLKLLRMQRYSDKSNTWVNINPTVDVIDGIKDKDAAIATPEMWGRYSTFTEEERDWYKECTVGSMHEVYYDDIIGHDETSDRRPFGYSASINLISPTPVKAIFWVAQNTKAVACNNYSNYTTNEDNVNHGWNPCLSYGLSYLNSVRISETDFDHAEKEEAWEFPRAPWEPGYNAIAFNNNPFSVNGDASIDLTGKGASLRVTLGNTDPDVLVLSLDKNSSKDGQIIGDDFEEEKDQTTDTATRASDKKTSFFKIKCRLLVCRKLSFYFDKAHSCFVFQTNAVGSS
jgi:hypothetical protein